MAEPYLGEIRLLSFGFAPRGWALCNGQMMPIQQNQALYSLLGVMYGGDGRITFALPNLQGKMPMHRSAVFAQGRSSGEYAHTLISQEMPTHTHTANGSNVDANTVAPLNGLLGANTNMYGPPTSLTPIQSGTLAGTGGSQPHENMQPYTVINFSIALQGTFPTQT